MAGSDLFTQRPAELLTFILSLFIFSPFILSSSHPPSCSHPSSFFLFSRSASTKQCLKLGEIIGFTIIHKGRTRTQTIVYQKINIIYTKVTSVISCGVLKMGAVGVTPPPSLWKYWYCHTHASTYIWQRLIFRPKSHKNSPNRFFINT